jgi:Domain of unknown function (DUF222)
MSAAHGTAAVTVLDAVHDPDYVAAWAASATPGPGVVEPLVWSAPDALSHEGRIDAIAATERQIAWLHAHQLTLLAALAQHTAPGQPDAGKNWVREEVACALRLSGQSAQARLALAEQLDGRLPATLAALARGQITLLHAMALAEHAYGLDEDTTTAIETRVLPGAGSQSLAEFKRSIRRARTACDARAAETRHQAAMARRCVQVSPGEDGMAHLYALLPADGAATLAAAITAVAGPRVRGDTRSADQRRADALIQLGVDTLTGRLGATATPGPGRGPGAAGVKPSIQVSVAASTLLGLDDQPGELDGHGPIPASLARRLAADPTGTWRRLLTDDTGRLLAVDRRTYRPPTNPTADPTDLTDRTGRALTGGPRAGGQRASEWASGCDRYRPPAALARHVIARDQTCRFPHCHRPALRCELDHACPWNAGGATSAANLHALCRRHHHAKHDAGWAPTRHDDGTTQWRSPTGRTYHREPATHPIDHTATLAAITTGTGTTTDPDPPPF